MSHILAKETSLGVNGQAATDTALQKSKSDEDIKGIGNKASMPNGYAAASSL